MKLPGVKGINSYKIIRKNFEVPGHLHIYHRDNLENRKKTAISPDGIAIVRDRQTTFGMVEQFYSNVYELLRSFKKNESSAAVNNETMVNDGPVIHIEGYEIPSDKYEKFEGWFNRWATRVYVPLLLEIPGVNACSFFKLVDYKDPRYDNIRYIVLEMPRYMSITYMKDIASVEECNSSNKFAAFRHAMELEFPSSLKTIWNTEYQQFSSHRP
jgi:hypothetical protein